jgi:hypothetical protein
MNKCGHKIPEDILNEIVLYVPGYQNIYKVSLCCKKFSELLNFELYKLFIRAFSKRFGDKCGQLVFDNENSIRFSVLGQNISDIFDFNLLICAIRQMKKLKILELHCYTTLEQQNIIKNLWIKRGNNLNKLYIQKFKYRDAIISKRNKAKKKLEEEKKNIKNVIEYVLVSLSPLLCSFTDVYFNINCKPLLLLLLFVFICVKLCKNIINK